jgi:alpha-N-arabinofuranosidase
MNMYHITLHPQFTIAPVDQRLFGGFLEHLGRAVYEGVFQPESIHADENGFRKDVLDALRALRFNSMRYPVGTSPQATTGLTALAKDRRP